MNLIDLQNFLIAIAVGGIIGLEREIGRREKKDAISFAGLRTFILVSFFGALSYFMGEKLNQPILPAVGFVIFSLLIIVSYYISAQKGFWGITTELTGLLTYLLGVLVMQADYQVYAVIFAVLITILLAFKKYVRRFIQKTKTKEWYDTMKFAFIAFVILPLLPNQGFGPYEFFNPYQTWLMVVFVSGLSFAGYFAVKYFGTRIGVSLSGLLGGIASSTAVTTSMSHRSKDVKEKDYKPFVIATVLACSIMFVRVILEAATINQELALILLFPTAIMFLAGIVPILLWWRKGKEKSDKELDLPSPFRLQPAIAFAAIYTFVQLVVNVLVHEGVGQTGIIFTSVIAGITDVDAITLSLSRFAQEGSITMDSAVNGILAALFTNTIVKGGIAWFWGGKEYRKKVAMILFAILLIGICSIFILRVT